MKWTTFFLKKIKLCRLWIKVTLLDVKLHLMVWEREAGINRFNNWNRDGIINGPWGLPLRVDCVPRCSNVEEFFGYGQRGIKFYIHNYTVCVLFVTVWAWDNGRMSNLAWSGRDKKRKEAGREQPVPFLLMARVVEEASSHSLQSAALSHLGFITGTQPPEIYLVQVKY